MGCCTSLAKAEVDQRGEREPPKELYTLHFILKESPAVLSFRGNSYFGKIDPNAKVCWVSFPGKFETGWESLISEHIKDSVACVFLCDTEHGLGQHYFPHDTPEQCLCAQIYGERNYKDLGYLQEVKNICTDEEKAERRKRAEAMKSHIVFGKASEKDREKAQQLWEQNRRRASWGCAWFQKWFHRVKTAVDLGQRLKVVFFPGHVGCGKVPWTMLPKVNLWDGIGCGGSQKGEIAKLDEMRRTDCRWDYDEVDVTEFLAEQFKPGDIVDAFDSEQNSFVTAKILPGSAKNHDHHEMKWPVVCQKTGKRFETKRLRHATDFFQKLLHLDVFGDDSLKKIVEEATKLQVKSVHESRLQNGMPSLAVDLELQSIQEKQKLRDAVLSDDLAFLLNSALEKGGITEELAIDKTSFFDQYASSLLTSSQLTNHQTEKLKELSRCLHEDIHLSAPAGAGKSFLAIRHAINKLRSSSQGKILFISPNRSLSFHFVHWLLTYAKCSLPKMSRTKLFQRIVLMHAPYERFMGVQIEYPHIDLQELTVMPDDLVLAVFDEAHEIFRTNQRIFQEVRAQQKLILSDLSQSFLLENTYPDMHEVNLTEVVRSTKRVVFGANVFQLQDEDDEPTTCLGTTGPPLKTFIFEVLQGYDGGLFAQFADNTVKALWFILQTYSSMRLDRHVALLVPNQEFHRTFRFHLEERLETDFAPTYKIRLVSFEESLRFLPEAVHQDRREDELILDWDSNAKGLEQLFVICIGFDAQITGDVDNFTRARLYHAITRAQLQAIVVDQFIRGGWLEFLNTLKLKETTFQADDAKSEIIKDAALKIVEETTQSEADSRPEAATKEAASSMGQTANISAEPQAGPKEPAVVGVLPTSIWDTSSNMIKTNIVNLKFDPRSSEEDPEDPEQVAADEAAAAKHDHIADAAFAGDLAAVRGHLRRDRRCLDQLFQVPGFGGRDAALHRAARDDHTAIVAFLLAKGAAADVRTVGGSTPLHCAAFHGRVESAKLLLAAKASVDMKDDDGDTPLDVARQSGHTEIVNLMMGKA